MKRYTKYALMVYAFFASLSFCNAQAGNIVVATTPATSPLNPNGDTWATTCACAYVTRDDATESEIPFVRIFQFTGEPDGDLSGGGACGTTDIVDNPGTGADASYVFYKDPNGVANSGDEYVIYRLRVAKNPGNANFGFSVLMDTDGLIGRLDPNYRAGNPGFEREIRVVNGGGSKGVYVDNIDGAVTGTNLRTYTLAANTQRVQALLTDPDCGAADVIFYDFYVMLSHMGISSTTPIRLVGATSVNGQTVLSAGASDIGGTDDNLMGAFGGSAIANQDSMFTLLVNAQPIVTLGTLPISLLYFKGKTSDNGTQLLWATASETNNDYFTIERSEDGKTYEVVTTIEGAKNSKKRINYQYTDKMPFYDKVYYRLKQTDFDGTYKYSPTIALNSGKDMLQNLSISVNGVRTTDFDLAANEQLVSVKITDVLGREIVSMPSQLTNDAHLNVELAASQIATNMILSVTTTQGVYSRKVRISK